MEKEEKPKSRSHFRSKFIRITVLLAFLGIGLYAWLHLFDRDKEADEKITVITESSLEKILQISDLSSYKAVYNGVACIPDKEDSGKPSYYTAYEAEVQVGIDMEQIQIQVDEEQKKVTVQLPETKINDVIVDMTSLDYIFVDKKAETKDVSSEAYSACIADVREESAANEEIIRLAEDNTIGLVKALLEPLFEQQDKDYTLEVKSSPSQLAQ